MIAIASATTINLPNSIKNLNDCVSFTSAAETESLQLEDLSIQIDEAIHFADMDIELVYVIRNSKEFNPIKQLQRYDESVYILDAQVDSSFYCKPHILSLLAILYKIDFVQYGFPNNNEEYYLQKLLYLMDRTGLTYYVN